MSFTSRRNFLALTSASAIGLSKSTEFLHAAQLPGQPPSTPAGAQDKDFSNVMAIAAHPGDAFFAMGAPVAVAAHNGGQASLLSLSLGERGSSSIPAEKYGSMQREASQKAASLIGAKALFLTYPDGEIPINEEAKFAVCDLIRQYKPSTVVTHWKGSWHKDHRACYDIVDDAVFYAGLPAIVRKDPALAIRKIFYADNWEDASGFAADTYLDISPVYDSWLNACSIFPMWRGENGFRYNDYYASLAVARGCIGNFKQSVALMSAEEQRIQRIRTP
jgi:N-acetylglucosamine malate deacetylase 1